MHYLIADDTFNERTDKIELLLRVRDKSKLNLTFAGYNRLDLIARKPEQILLLNELNFNGMFFGIESMNHQAAKFIGKGCKPEEITNTLHKLKDSFGKKLITTAGFIIGLPHDTPETVEEWTRTILQKDYPLDFYRFHGLVITQNSNTSSVFSLNREKYGFKTIENSSFSEYTWKNDVWDYGTCQKLAKSLNDRANALNKRLSPFISTAMIKYGYTWDELTDMNTSDIAEYDMVEKHQKYIDDYIIRLENYVFKK
jgi:radical SAM superfamily enzyme YgiQ (UPF0313 family)